MSEEESRSLRRRASKRRATPSNASPLVAALLRVRANKKPRTSETEKKSSKSFSEHRQAYRFIGPGKPLPDGSVNHTTLEVTALDGSSYHVCIGDSVFLLPDGSSLSGDAAISLDDAFVARVERMWEGAPPKKKKRMESVTRMNLRWYFKKRDVETLDGDFAGAISRNQLLTAMTPSDLVLSNQTDDNDICTIIGKCRVVLRRPSSEPLPSLPENTFVSRYSINFRTNLGTAIVTAHDGPNEDWSDDANMAETDESGTRQSLRIKRKASGRSRDGDPGKENTSQDVSSASSMSSDESSGDESTSSQDRAPETEGSTTKGHINVGPEHQVQVTPYSGKQSVCSRSPVLVWKPNETFSDEEYDQYLARAAGILTPFLEEHGLLAQEPYSPLPSAKLEARLNTDPYPQPMTLSSVSTGSSLVSARNSKLTRECNIDAILAILVEKNFDVQSALSAIAESPRDFLAVWTKAEKELFDRGFRRHTGSLRAIRKIVETSKSYKDIVDYHYRFKIPDQYRRYQEKSREQAIRMMDCIEKRRYHETIVSSRDDSRKKWAKDSDGNPGDWSKTGANAVIGAVEQRRSAAKEVLLEIQTTVGTDALVLIANAVKALHDPSSVNNLKNVLLGLLKDHPDLLERSMDFLPLRYRA